MTRYAVKKLALAFSSKRNAPLLTVSCKHCGATMKFVSGPMPWARVNTYSATCERMDLSATELFPQRCGNICFRNIPAEVVA